MITKSDIKTLIPHKNLSTSIWKNRELNSEVREKLLKIAHDFYVFLEVSVPILDITLTGSLANFNYTDESDIDLHIIIDYSAVDSNIRLVEMYMQAKKSVWNEKHDIRIKGHEVELYAQNSSEAHHSTGVFSILNNEWVSIPKKGGARINMDAAKKKTRAMILQIDKVLQSPDRMKKIEKMKEKIRNMRSAGLKRAGEYSSENLAFKLLRRTGYLKKMYDIHTSDYDSYMSLDES